jgi:ABC-type nitrate/sulfonate/bicarbonate transport system ATPase subunit
VRLEVDIASKTFRNAAGEQHDVIAGVAFALDAGEVGVLVGPSGCGKSTMLRILTGLDPDFQGHVSRPAGARIGFVFQEPRLLPWRSVAANVTYPLELAGWPAARRTARLAELLELVGLEGAAGLRPVQLSGGMRQRASIARALALGPRVLLLDEPFSALDALTRERFNLELLELQAQTATTVVIVTHSIPEAILLADRVIVLTPQPGRVAAEIRIDAPRPRAIGLLDHALVSEAAATIRRHLSTGEEAA